MLLERGAQRPGECDRSRLVAVQAERAGSDCDAPAREARDLSFFDHRERLRHRFLFVLDHTAGHIARRERAIVLVAAVGKAFPDGASHFAAHSIMRLPESA